MLTFILGNFYLTKKLTEIGLVNWLVNWPLN